MTARADQPRPPRKPTKACPHCGKANEPHREKCWSCHKPMSGRAAIAQAVERVPSLNAKTRRVCRTPAEAFAAGWEDGADDPPLTPEQRTRVAALLAPHIRPAAVAA